MVTLHGDSQRVCRLFARLYGKYLRQRSRDDDEELVTKKEKVKKRSTGTMTSRIGAITECSERGPRCSSRF